MPKVIYVLNASSRTDTGITDDLSRSLESLRSPHGPTIECLTLAEGPNGISTKRDSDKAAVAVTEFIEQFHDRADTGAFVIACFTDPGVEAAREFSQQPVLGIGQSGIATALTLGDRLGLIAVSRSSEGRNRRLLRGYGHEGSLAGHASLDLDYADLQAAAIMEERLSEVALHLTTEMGANVLLFAAAGLERYRVQLEQAAGVPVIDPTQAATGLATTLVRLAAHSGNRTVPA